jgi:hypothetical protein
LLASQILIKDVGVPADHGEFTHRIQWYLLMRKFEGNSFNAPKLLKSMAESVYRWREGTNDKGHSIWTALFDRFPSDPFGAESATDFRRPENLHTYLTSNAAPYRLVSSFLSKRMEKRTEPKSDFNYIARKLYRKESFAKLDAAQQQEVRQLFQLPDLSLEPNKDGSWSKKPVQPLAQGRP